MKSLISISLISSLIFQCSANGDAPNIIVVGPDGQTSGQPGGQSADGIQSIGTGSGSILVLGGNGSGGRKRSKQPPLIIVMPPQFRNHHSMPPHHGLNNQLRYHRVPLPYHELQRSYFMNSLPSRAYPLPVFVTKNGHGSPANLKNLYHSEAMDEEMSSTDHTDFFTSWM
ncbi:hypothetical protein HDE_10434 [Halotydeus destructor]|nr:hypothetical protein HDE_10434 [Halotydeus destructor]